MAQNRVMIRPTMTTTPKQATQPLKDVRLASPLLPENETSTRRIVTRKLTRAREGTRFLY
jgi:hypothetical protein